MNMSAAVFFFLLVIPGGIMVGEGRWNSSNGLEERWNGLEEGFSLSEGIVTDSTKLITTQNGLFLVLCTCVSVTSSPSLAFPVQAVAIPTDVRVGAVVSST